MKTITLTQPWATLMQNGYKRIETRSWPTKYRGPLLIHAAKGFPEEARERCRQEPFKMELRALGYDLPAELPRGVIIARVELVDCVRTEWLLRDHSDKASELRTRHFGSNPLALHEEEFGDYGDGRWAWICTKAEPTAHVEVRGALGLWDFPDHRLGELDGEDQDYENPGAHGQPGGPDL